MMKCQCGYEFTKEEIENKPGVSDVETWHGCPKCGIPIL